MYLVWFGLNHTYSVFSALTWMPIPPAAVSRLCGLGGCLCQQRYVIRAVRICHRVLPASHLFFFFFLVKNHFLSLNISTFETRSLGRWWTGMVLKYHLTEHLRQYQRSLYLHLVSRLLLLCFYTVSLWLQRFLWGDHRQEVFASSSLWVWSQMPRRNLQIRMSP